MDWVETDCWRKVFVCGNSTHRMTMGHSARFEGNSNGHLFYFTFSQSILTSSVLCIANQKNVILCQFEFNIENPAEVAINKWQTKSSSSYIQWISFSKKESLHISNVIDLNIAISSLSNWRNETLNRIVIIVNAFFPLCYLLARWKEGKNKQNSCIDWTHRGAYIYI